MKNSCLKYIFIIVSILFHTNIYSQSEGHNYVISSVMTDSTGTKSMDVIQYFDGFGRLIETVQRGASPSKKDLVTIKEYDLLGRESANWLPGLSSENGAFVDLPTAKNNAISLNGNDKKPYSMVVYELSPLNKIVKEFGPGEGWHDGDKAVKTTYTTLPCLIIKIVGDGVQKAGEYKAGQLFTTMITDEDNNVSYEFRNFEDQLVMTNQISEGKNHYTYYVYDDFGNLRYVLPPNVADALYSGSLYNDTNQDMDNFAYIYKYDERQRCIKKKLPGCDWIEYKYDNADRLIFSQDGEQRIKPAPESVVTQGRWSFSIYDALGRVILVGESENATVNGVVKGEYQKDWPYHFGYNMSGLGFSWNHCKLYTINYYDNYDFLERADFKNLGYDARSGYATRYGDNNNKIAAKGLPTGTVTALLDNSGKFIYTAFYYDERGRVIQSKSTNHLGGIESEYIAYNFTGQPVSKLHDHSKSINGEIISELYTYTYDHAGRLTETKHKLNTNAEISLAKNEYDDLGRLKFSTAAGNAALKVENTYNVRSWVKSISSNHFWEKLDYSHGGNISKMEWCQEAKIRSYAFGYDGLSRLKTASYTGEGKYGTSYEYDKMGNPTKVTREGMVNTSQYGQVDNLTFTYRGNQALTAKDNAPYKPLISTSYDFKDYSANKVNPQYVYNKNGALTEDPYKGVKISYNSLNLPQEISISAIQGSNNYLYSADGQKLQVTSEWVPNLSLDPLENTTGGTGMIYYSINTTDYVGNKIYTGFQRLEKILTDNGYYDYRAKKYYFYLRDHLGNNRAVADANAVISQRTHYYPFGLPFADGTEQTKQPYKYNNKEFDTMHGLNKYDYHARNYDSGKLTFDTFDPLGEKSYSESPYAYVSNNPLKYIDPDGKEKINKMGPHDNGERKVSNRKHIDNGMIHIYAHGKYNGFGYQAGITNIHINNQYDFEDFLNQNSSIWKTRQKGEQIYIILHSCNVGEDYEDPADGKPRNFAKEMSLYFTNHIIGAPSDQLGIDSKEEVVRDKETQKIGTWNFYKNGKLIGQRSGDANGNPDLIDYKRPKSIKKNSEEDAEKAEDRKKAEQKVGEVKDWWQAVRRDFYNRFGF